MKPFCFRSVKHKLNSTVIICLAISIMLGGLKTDPAAAKDFTLTLNKRIEHSTNAFYNVHAYYSTIKVTQDYFIISIRPTLSGTSFYEFTVGNLIPVKVEGYTLGTDTEKIFSVYVPRQYKRLYIKGVNKFGQDTYLDLTPYDKFVKARTGRKGLGDSEKPKIYLTSPSIKNRLYRTQELYITIQGKVTDNLGILGFKINDKKVTLAESGLFKKRIKLKLGKNSVLFKATDVNNNSTTADFVVIRDEIIEETEFSDVDFPKPLKNKNKNAIAVVFGIENYRNAPSVTHAINDADIFREYLIKRFGFQRQNIYLRLDEQASKAEFDKVFSENGWISRHATPKTDVIIYYAGHGAPDIKSRKSFLIPHDGDPNYSSQTGYSTSKLYENLGKIKAKSITVILDSCFSGISRDNKPLLAQTRDLSLVPIKSTVPANIIVFSAATGSEISSGFDKKSHGIFTYYFLKGLSGDADQNHDRKITAEEMQSFLSAKVSVKARTMGREQHPQLLGVNKNRVLLSY